MVVLETAAITAAGYGLYKGGEAGIRKGKECKKEFQREQKRGVHRNELGQKTQARSQRISQIMSQRRGSTGNVEAATATPASSLRAASSSNLTSSSSRTDSSASSSDVKDRHQAVMAKLRSGRREESKKSGNGGLFKNPFKKK
ncbi:MAG: hypothetical protein SGILL_008533 [Bacillariaceae sp.]